MLQSDARQAILVPLVFLDLLVRTNFRIHSAWLNTIEVPRSSLRIAQQQQHFASDRPALSVEHTHHRRKLAGQSIIDITEFELFLCVRRGVTSDHHQGTYYTQHKGCKALRLLRG